MLQLSVVALVTAIILVRSDPTPTGGMLCSQDDDCGNGIINGGNCTKVLRNGTEVYICRCFPSYGNIDCSYHRKDKVLAGILQITLAFCGINGVGNFILGRNSNAGGQLALGILSMCIIVTICCVACLGYATQIVGPSIACAVCLSIICCMIIISGFIWTVADGGLILAGNIPDGNGYYPA